MACINDSKNTVHKEVQSYQGRLQVVYGDSTLGLAGEREGKKFHYIFSYARGGPESICIEGREWLYRCPVPTFWRALTDNDRGSRFHLKSGMWLAADQFIKCSGVQVQMNGKEIPLPTGPENNRYQSQEYAEAAAIVYSYETLTCPPAQVQVSYLVDKDGTITVKADYFGKEGLPELPVFGMRFLMPTCADRFVYEGLSGETYPDRKAGGVPGVYEVEGLPVTPYLVPQDCGMHMDTKWVEIYRSTGLDNSRQEKKEQRLRFETEGLAFSALPYTACELENATHQEELPLARRTVLCIYGAVRGVGGIDSWGSDVEDAYHVDAQKEIHFSFRIVP